MNVSRDILRWKKPQYRRQATHDGRYWVSKNWHECCQGRWFAWSRDSDEPLTFDGFWTRWEAKEYCERYDASTRPT